MCGIAGFNWRDSNLINKISEKIKHRGPDQFGDFCDESVSLGHRRLSIIDLSEKGKQPMCNEDKTIWITFNGEIYNFQEIKDELLKKGHTFRSNTDTEVIIHSYEEWGEKCVNGFNGMWAFCIYDSKKKIFFLSRDRFGKKPLYYFLEKGKFIFSSEIKAILESGIKKELNPTSVSSFLAYRYVLGEETFFKNLFKLLPAHNLVFDLVSKKIIKNYEYWDLISEEKTTSEEEAISKVEESLIKSVNYRKISDVPLGVILSGGLDSSIVSAILSNSESSPINTFTVKFKEDLFDETKFAKLVANKYNANYSEVILDTSNFIEVMKEYIQFKDEPIGVPNEIALYLLSKKISEKVKVVLSGEGADEIFEGYGRIFSSARDYYLLKKIQEKYSIEEAKIKYPNLFSKYPEFFSSALDHFLFMYGYWKKEELNKILLESSKKDWSEIFRKAFCKINANYEKIISYIFLKIHLPGLLNRLDSPTMANSIEARAPFLDFNLANLAFNLPLNLKTRWKTNELDFDETCDKTSENKNISKFVLKELSKKYLPSEIIERKKQGFPLPLDNWFEGNMLEFSKKLLLTPNSKISKVINLNELNSWINSSKNHPMFGQKLWMLLSLELWLDYWFKEL